MVRPLSGDKREAILKAAAEIVAEQGVSAPTAKMSKLAGVAEGTLFKYFTNKDHLLNDLYLDLKSELSSVLAQEYPEQGPFAERARHLWERYVDWGVRNQAKHRALQQLAVAECITATSRAAGRVAMDRLCDVLLDGAIRNPEISQDFATALLTSIANITVDFVIREPEKARHHTTVGFEAYWRALGGE
jgi:AcrR family transcriptional regulator